MPSYSVPVPDRAVPELWDSVRNPHSRNRDRTPLETMPNIERAEGFSADEHQSLVPLESDTSFGEQMWCEMANCDVRSREMWVVDGGAYVCEEHHDVVARCESCSGLLFASDITWCGIISRFWCANCRINQLQVCGGCNVAFIVNGSRSHRCSVCDVSSICAACMAAHHTHSRPRVHGHAYRPEFNFLGHDKLYLGVELEVDGGNRSRSRGEYPESDNFDSMRDFWELSEDERLFFVKYDGSLGSQGFEVVTHPATLRFHQRKFPWKAMLENLQGHGYFSHQTTTCGLHVHASRAGLGDTPREQQVTILKLVLLFWRNWPHIFKFTRRTEQTLHQWARANHLYNPSEENIVHKLEQCASANIQGRYQAINMSNADTIEFRLFRGTLTYDTLIATLQFVQLAIDFVRDRGASGVYNSTWQDFEEAAANYPQLSKYLAYLRTIGEADAIDF